MTVRGKVDEAPPNTATNGRELTGASVTLEHLEKRFTEVLAVDNVSLTIQPGEFITLLGPSGSGKTTTLMMIAGFEIPTAGEIYIDDRPIVTVPPYHRNIGMVFQNYALFPHMTVAENIAFPLKQRKVAKDVIARRVAEVLEIVKLPGYEPRYPRQLSGGQQQRVALARAIVFEPQVLLMDEPLGALDKKLREGLQLEIKRLHKELGMTFIYVTHDQEEALVMSDRIAVMDHGQIEQVGTPVDLYDRPRNRFVSEFIGESNFLTGIATQVDAHRVDVKIGDGTIQAVCDGHIQVHEGARVTVAVRPEKFAFTDEPGAGEGGQLNHLAAVVRDVTFVGEMRRYLLDTTSGTMVTIKQPQRFSTRIHSLGDQIELEWHVEDTRVVSLGD